MTDAVSDRSPRMKVAAAVMAVLAAWTVGCSEPPSPAAGDTLGIPAASAPASPGNVQEAAGPTLTITSPASGDTVTAPVTIRYAVLGVDFKEGMRLLAFVDSMTATPIEIPLRGSSGTAVLPSHPLLGGRRDLILQLTRADLSPVEGARVTLHGLIIEGERAG